jgi:adenylate cyclase
MKKNQNNALFYAALILGLMFMAEVLAVKLLNTAEYGLSDLFVRSHALGLEADPDILIINIDEKSLAEMNLESEGDIDRERYRWPWPRFIYGELIEGLAPMQPAAIVFDLFFTESDIDAEGNISDSDIYFNEVLLSYDNIYLPIVRRPAVDDAEYGIPLAEYGPALGFTSGKNALETAKAGFNLPHAVAPEAWRIGLINFEEDPDGVGRRYLVKLDEQGWLIPSLPARVVGDLGGVLPDTESINLYWRGEAGTFTTRSFSDIYGALTGLNQQELDEDDFSGKIIVIGSDATGLHDLRVTPIDSLYPGVEIIATAISNLKEEEWYRLTSPVIPLLLGLLLITGLALLFRRGINPLRTGLMLMLSTLLALIVIHLGVSQKLLLHLLTPFLFAWAYFLIAWFMHYIDERRAREQTEQAFKRTMDPRVVERLINQGKTIEDLGGETRELTVLFSDIRGFTTLSEQHSAEEIVDILNRYFSLQVATIFKYGGTLDKFIGDAIMAFWGAPEDDPDQAVNAVRAAIEMVENLRVFRDALSAEGIEFDVGIGLHTGTAVVGFIGSETRKDYTVIGDTVNLASRLEGLTKGIARVLISQDTKDRCGDLFQYTEHGSHQVKGREEAVTVFEPKEHS